MEPKTKQESEAIVREIRRQTRRRFSSEDKIRIILEGLKGEDSIAAIARRDGINPALYYKWSKDFLEAGKHRLLGPHTNLTCTREHFPCAGGSVHHKCDKPVNTLRELARLAGDPKPYRPNAVAQDYRSHCGTPGEGARQTPSGKPFQGAFPQRQGKHRPNYFCVTKSRKIVRPLQLQSILLNQ